MDGEPRAPLDPFLLSLGLNPDVVYVSVWLACMLLLCWWVARKSTEDLGR